MEMGQSYFIWNGVDCRSKGILLNAPAPIIRPEERVKHITIPGVSGDLTELEGENIYNSYIQTVTMHVKSGMRVREIYRWLRGDGYVTFSGEPDRRQRARIIGAVTLNRHSRNLDWWSGEVQFYCQPLKELLTESRAVVDESGMDVLNGGDVAARPKYGIYVTGTSVTLSVTGDGLPDDNAILIEDLASGDFIEVDAETMEVWKGDELITKNSTGNFPVLAPGHNTVSGSGWAAVAITKKERYL